MENSKSMSYKVSTFYDLLARIINDIFSRGKQYEYLIESQYNYPEIKELPILKKDQFSIKIIDDLVQKSTSSKREGTKYVSDISLNYSSHQFEHPRLKELSSIYEEHKIIDKKVFNIRFSIKDYAMIDAIKELAKKSKTTNGKVIEQALANFITQCDSKLYEVIKHSFTLNLR